MDPVTLIMGLASLVPNILHLFGASDSAQNAATTAVQVAQTVANVSDPQAAVAAIQSNPQLQAQYQAALAQKIQAIEQAKSAQMQAVNNTIQSEVQNHRGYWREACGYVVASGSFLSVLVVSYLFYIALKVDPQALAMVTPFTMAITSILMVPGAAVGICAWHQGKVDQINATQTN